LPAAGWHAGAEQQTVEADAFVAQRVAFVDADDGVGEALDVLLGGKRRPRQRVPGVQRLDPVSERAAVVVQVEQDAVILGGRGVAVLRPGPGDVGAERIERLDEADVAIALQLQAGGERQVAAAALARR
jgi:hypothetical protein